MLPRVPLKSFSLPIFRPAPGSPAWVGGCWQCGSWRSSPFHMRRRRATQRSCASTTPTASRRPTSSLAFADDLTQDWDGPADALVAEVRRTEELALRECSSTQRGPPIFLRHSRHCRWRQPPEGCRWRNRGNAHPRIQPDRRPSADGAAASHRRGRAEPHVGRLQRAASPEALPSARGGDPP